MVCFILLCIATLCILILIYQYFQKQYFFWRDLNVPYVKPSIPFGNFKDVVTMKTCPGDFLREIYNKTQEKVLGIWIFWMPYLIIKDPALINSVLIKDFNHFTHRAMISEKSDSICSKLIFFLSNPDWKNVRSKISPQFSSAKLKVMTPFIEEATEDMKSYLRECEGKSVDSKEISSKFITDIISSCMFGLKGNSFSKEDPVFYNLAKKLFGVRIPNLFRFLVYFFLPDIGRFFKIAFADPSVTNCLRKIVWQTINTREMNNDRRGDIIDRLIQLRRSKVDVHGDGNGFDGDRVVAIPVQMFIGGIETTAGAFAFALFEIGLHQTIQEKIREEIKSTIDAHEGLTYEAIKNMVYLDKVIMEIMRKYPIFPYVDRKTVVDYKLPGTDFVVKKGVTIYVPLTGIHYDPKYYPNPEVFDPERFSKENIAKRMNNVYLPFGSGPRQCIGSRFAVLGMKIGIIQILREFRIGKCDKTVPTVFHPQGGLLIAKDGLWNRYERIYD